MDAKLGSKKRNITRWFTFSYWTSLYGWLDGTDIEKYAELSAAEELVKANSLALVA